MKVLLSAIACHPHLGSESKVGWDAARAISELPEVEECHVMTQGANKEAIIRAQDDGQSGKVHFHFFGEPFRYHPNRLLARLQSWLLYRDWQIKSLPRALELHQQHGLSLVHHVTFASWRMPPRLWRMPIPFVFGPVGGATTMLPAFRTMLSKSSRSFELLRDVTTALGTRSTSLRLCCTQSAAVLAADAATATFLSEHGAESVHTLCQVFFSEHDVSRFKTAIRGNSDNSGALRIFAGGNLEGRKGTRLSLQALAVLKKKGIPFSYTYGGWGPDLEAMKHLAHQLGIADQVCFHRGYSGDDYTRQLNTSDVYLLPSIRETAGITMMEATIAGCYPIVLAGTGAGDIVERTGGAAIQAKTPEEAIHQIADKLEWCHRHRSQTYNQAEVAGRNLRKMYSREAYQAAIYQIYTSAIAKHRARPSSA